MILIFYENLWYINVVLYLRYDDRYAKNIRMTFGQRLNTDTQSFMVSPYRWINRKILLNLDNLPLIRVRDR